MQPRSGWCSCSWRPGRVRVIVYIVLVYFRDLLCFCISPRPQGRGTSPSYRNLNHHPYRFFSLPSLARRSFPPYYPILTGAARRSCSYSCSRPFAYTYHSPVSGIILMCRYGTGVNFHVVVITIAALMRLNANEGAAVVTHCIVIIKKELRAKGGEVSIRKKI